MRNFLFVFFILLIYKTSFGQSKKANYLIDSAIYEISIKKHDNNSILYCFNVIASLKKEIKEEKDVCFTSYEFSKQELQIQFVNYYQTKTGVNVNDSLKGILFAIAEGLYSKYQYDENYDDPEYGRNKYYGLTEGQIMLLKLKKDSLSAVQKILKKYKIGTLFHGPKRFELNGFENTLEYKVIAAKHTAYLTKNKTKNEKEGKDVDNLSETYELFKFERKVLKREIKSLLSGRKPIVSFIGNANVVASYKTAETSQINAGFGIEVAVPKKSDFIGILTVAQTNDTIISSEINDFGQSILVPGVRRFSLLTSYRNYSMFPTSGSNLFKKIGIAFNANITPYRWSLNKADGTPDSVTTRVVPVSADLIFPFTWVSLYEEDKDVAISTDIGLSFRYVGGNITPEQLNTFLHRDTRFYAGLLFGLNIKYNGLRAQFHGPIFFGKQVDGLTSGQVYASIGFVSSILSNEKGILKKK